MPDLTLDSEVGDELFDHPPWRVFRPCGRRWRQLLHVCPGRGVPIWASLKNGPQKRRRQNAGSDHERRLFVGEPYYSRDRGVERHAWRVIEEIVYWDPVLRLVAVDRDVLAVAHKKGCIS